MRGKLTYWMPGAIASFTFNEARALCAGSFRSAVHYLAASIPSMRPAHCAREVTACRMAMDARWFLQ